MLAVALVLGLAGCKEKTKILRPDMDALRAANVGSYVFFGEYEQDNDVDTGKEAIEWLVLAKEEDRMLLISRYGLDCQKYNSEDATVIWLTCSLRDWLNNSFYNLAFTPEEKNLILDSTITYDGRVSTTNLRSAVFATKTPETSNSMEHDTPTMGGAGPENRIIEVAGVTDKLFLFTIDEVEQYFTDDAARACPGTPYCYTRGAWKDANGNCWWWLRTSGLSGDRATYVLDDGEIHSEGAYVTHDKIAVRPAMWINIGEGK